MSAYQLSADRSEAAPCSANEARKRRFGSGFACFPGVVDRDPVRHPLSGLCGVAPEMSGRTLESTPHNSPPLSRLSAPGFSIAPGVLPSRISLCRELRTTPQAVQQADQDQQKECCAPCHRVPDPGRWKCQPRSLDSMWGRPSGGTRQLPRPDAPSRLRRVDPCRTRHPPKNVLAPDTFRRRGLRRRRTRGRVLSRPGTARIPRRCRTDRPYHRGADDYRRNSFQKAGLRHVVNASTIVMIR